MVLHGRMNIKWPQFSTPPSIHTPSNVTLQLLPTKGKVDFPTSWALSGLMTCPEPTESGRSDTVPVSSADLKRPCMFLLPLLESCPPPCEQDQTCLINDEICASVTLHHPADSQPTARNMRSHHRSASLQPTCQVTTDTWAIPDEISSTVMSQI